MMFYFFINNGYSQYPIYNHISTNPDSPVNNQLPIKKNTFFNWQIQDWQVKPLPNQGFCTTGPIITSPFFRLDNLELLRTTKDMKWIDGWELLYRRVGLYDNNTQIPDNDNDITILLYNKYTGLLRVLMKTCRLEDYQTVQIDLSFPGATAFKTDLLELSRNTVSALDKTFTPTEYAAASKFVNNSTKWFYADFPMMYDPCTPLYPSKLKISATLISNSELNIKGVLNGDIFTKNTNNKAEVVGGKNYSFNNANALTIGSKFFSSFDSSKFISSALSYGSTVQGEYSSTSWQPYALGSFLNTLNFMKAGIGSNSYIDGAVKFLDFFVTGGKKAVSPTQKVEVTPMSISMTADLKGTITKASVYNDHIFLNPGSKDAELDVDNYPLYNEVLGVFNLIKTPEVYYERTYDEPLTNYYLYPSLSCPTYSTTYPNIQPWSCPPLNVNVDRFKLDINTIKYVLNPAAEVDIQDMYFQFVLDGEYFPNYSMNASYQFNQNKRMTPDFEYIGVQRNPNSSIDIYKFKSPLETAKTFCNKTYMAISPRSVYEPNQGYGNNSYNNLWSPWRPVGMQTVPTAFLKVFLTLKRKNADSLTQNISYVITYPVKLKNAPYLKYYGYSNHNFPNNIYPDYTLIPPATTSEVANFCTQAPYYSTARTTIANPPSFDSLVNLNSNVENKILSIFPNPSKGTFTLKLKKQNSLLKAINIYDISGRQVFSTNVNDNLNIGLTKVINLKAIPGTYLISLETTNGKIKDKIIIY